MQRVPLTWKAEESTVSLTILPFKSALQLPVSNLFGTRDQLVEDNFFMDRVGGDGFEMIQARYIQADLLLCNPVPNRPGPVLVCGLEVGDAYFSAMY